MTAFSRQSEGGLCRRSTSSNGIAVNPLRPDLIECLDKAGIPHVSIESLKEKAYSLVGRPDDLQWEDQVVAVLEARDGTILDVVRKIRPYDPDND